MRGAARAIVTTARDAARAVAAGLLLSVVSCAVPAPLSAGAADDRLDRFRELAPIIDSADGATLAEVYALLDGEIAESLAGGGVFASAAFLQDRLEAFAEAWGGLAVRLVALDRTMVAAFSFTELPRGSTVRFYARSGGATVPLTSLAGEGWPALRALPPGPAGARQILLTWEGPAGADGARPVRFEVVAENARGVRVVWSSAVAAPEGLMASWYAIRGSEIAIRHQTRYPGWTSGCAGQAEYEDVYRLNPGASAFTRVSRREINSWHRELHAAAQRVFAALASGDRAALGILVTDVSLRARLPSSLRHAPACAAFPGRDGAVTIAAEVGQHEPWTLTFRRGGGRWGLAAATPIVP